MARRRVSAELLTIARAAEILDIPERTARRDVERHGTLAGVPVIRVSGTRYVSRTRLLQALGKLPEPTTT